MDWGNKFVLQSWLLYWLHSFQNTSGSESPTGTTSKLIFDSGHMTWATYRPVDVLESKLTKLVSLISVDKLLFEQKLGLELSFYFFLCASVHRYTQNLLILVVVEVSGEIDGEHSWWLVVVHCWDIPLCFFPVSFAHVHLGRVFVGLVVLRDKIHKLLVFLGERERAGPRKSDT